LILTQLTQTFETMHENKLYSNYLPLRGPYLKFN